MNKNFTVNVFSEKSIQQLIRDLEDYKQEIDRKVNLLVQRVATELEELVRRNFSGTLSEISWNNSLGIRNYLAPEVSFGIDGDGNSRVVWASGQDAIWVEFGTGVYYNGGAGSSPHPKGSQLGFTIGSYGEGHGKKKTWGYYEDGILYMTHGVPARMPMYKAVEEITAEIANIAFEVFE